MHSDYISTTKYIHRKTKKTIKQPVRATRMHQIATFCAEIGKKSYQGEKAKGGKHSRLLD